MGADSRQAGRLLLGDAVHVAAAEQDLATRYGDHAPVREETAVSIHRSLVMAIPEDRQDDGAVAEVGVDVGASQPFSGLARLATGNDVDAGGFFLGDEDRVRLVDAGDLELATGGVGGVLENLEELASTACTEDRNHPRSRSA